MQTINKEKFEQVAQKIDPQSKLLRAWELTGGVSAHVTALEIDLPDGTTRKMIVRQHGPKDLERNPNIAADEYTLLKLAHAAHLAAPAPLYLDQSGDPFPTPFVVLEYMEGATDFAPADLDDYLSQMAHHLAAIHTAHIPVDQLQFLPKQREIYDKKLGTRPDLLDESLDEGRIRDVLEAAWPRPRRNKTVLLHGDFWPGNILWQNGRLSAIIDWEDAMLGDPLGDLAISRLDLLWAFDASAMEKFTEAYRTIRDLDFTDLAFWDLCAALRPAFQIANWAADATAEKAMREKHRLFVAQAIAKLSVKPSL